METLQFDNENFILYGPDSLKYITDKMPKILDEDLSSYLELFGVDSYRKVEIHYFDNIEEFREYVYNIRGEKSSLPKYATGTFDEGKIIYYIQTNYVEGSILYERSLHAASHELFHLMYKELILDVENIPGITWFDEGMAMLFSHEYEYDLSSEYFDDWFNWVIKHTKVIPDLNGLEHGAKFDTDDYGGYNLSLLAVKYLFETLGLEEFKKLMRDADRIKFYGKTVIEDAFKYYKRQIKM